MEALLKIIELSEKEGSIDQQKLVPTDDAGVYHVTLPKADGYARDGVGLYEPDTMHSWMIVNGDRPAFPALEDMPRDERVSFDVYYFITPDRVAHRITLTRAHGPYTSFVKACFVDGNLIYMCGAGRLRFKALLFNPKEWNSGATKDKLPHFWFHIGNFRVDVIADVYATMNKVLWKGFRHRTPDHYGIFINEQSTLTGDNMQVQQRQRAHFWPAIFTLVFLLPLWVLYQIAQSLVINPARMSAAKCQVRKYVVQENERGSFRHNPAGFDTLDAPGETTRLLV